MVVSTAGPLDIQRQQAEIAFTRLLEWHHIHNGKHRLQEVCQQRTCRAARSLFCFVCSSYPLLQKSELDVKPLHNMTHGRSNCHHTFHHDHPCAMPNMMFE